MKRLSSVQLSKSELSCPCRLCRRPTNMSQCIGAPSADGLRVILTRLVLCFLVSLALQMAAGCELMNTAEKKKNAGGGKETKAGGKATEGASQVLTMFF